MGGNAAALRPWSHILSCCLARIHSFETWKLGGEFEKFDVQQEDGGGNQSAAKDSGIGHLFKLESHILQRGSRLEFEGVLNKDTRAGALFPSRTPLFTQRRSQASQLPQNCPTMRGLFLHVAVGALLVCCHLSVVSADCPNPDFPNQCYGDAGTTYVCCDTQSCGLASGGSATCASGKYPPGTPTPAGAPPATPAPTTGGGTTPRNPAFDPVQTSWCSNLVNNGPLAGYTNLVTSVPGGSVPSDWHCFPDCDGDLSYQQLSDGTPYVRLTNINVGYKAFSFSLAGSTVPVGSQQQVLFWVQLGPGPNTQNKMDLNFVINGQYVCAGAVLIAKTGCWSLLSAGYQIQAVPNTVEVRLQGITNQDIWLHSVSIVSVPKNLYLNDLTTRTNAIRKTDVSVQVVDASNNPVSGASIQLTQTRTSFPVGGSLQAGVLTSSAYQNFFLSLFNTAVFENEMKWYSTDPNGPTFDYSTPDAMLTWCDNNNIKVRGHNIFWDIPEVQQDWVKALSTAGGIPGSDLYKAMVARLQSIVSHYKGRVIHWDVNNEQFHGGYYEGKLGTGIDDWMYPAVKQIDPNVKNALNDYNYVETCADPVAYPEFYLQQLNALTSRGLPIDILAFQGQFLGVEPLQLRQRLDKIASSGIPIWMSEVNVNILDVNKRADYLEFIFRECFAHPAVKGFLFWYVNQGPDTYQQNGGQCNACLANLDYSLNAAGQRVKALLQEFTTPPQSGTTDGNGRIATFNAYFGNFDAQITVGGTTYTRSFTVPETPGVQRNVVLSLAGTTGSSTPTPTPTATSSVTPSPTSPSGTPAPSPAGGSCANVNGFPNQCYAPNGDTFVCCDNSGCGPASGNRATCASNKYAGAPVTNPNPTPGPTPGPTGSSATPAPTSSSTSSPTGTPAPVPTPAIQTPAPGTVPNPSPAGGVCDYQSQYPNQCYGPDGSGYICCDTSGCGPFANGHATCASGRYSR